MAVFVTVFPFSEPFFVEATLRTGWKLCLCPEASLCTPGSRTSLPWNCQPRLTSLPWDCCAVGNSLGLEAEWVA